MHVSIFKSVFIISIIFVLVLPKSLFAIPPSSKDVDVYSSLCRTGFLNKFTIDGEVGLISRRLTKGEAKLSSEAILDEFPGIKNERNKLEAIQSFQDCVYRYVQHFHPTKNAKTAESTQSVISPSVPLERRREIIYLANQIEEFKNKMEVMKSQIPERYYDKRNSKEVKPLRDSRILNLENYSNYKAFQSADGIPDFSQLSNNDIVILCDTFNSEVTDYIKFYRDYRKVFKIEKYKISNEISRLCNSAQQGR